MARLVTDLANTRERICYALWMVHRQRYQFSTQTDTQLNSIQLFAAWCYGITVAMFEKKKLYSIFAGTPRNCNGKT